MNRYLFCTLALGPFILTGVHDEDTLRFGAEVCQSDGAVFLIAWVGFGFAVGWDADGWIGRELVGDEEDS